MNNILNRILNFLKNWTVSVFYRKKSWLVVLLLSIFVVATVSITAKTNMIKNLMAQNNTDNDETPVKKKK